MKKQVLVMALGGTISMENSTSQEGLQSKLGAKELVQQVPGVDCLAELRCLTIDKIPSASITFEHLFRVLYEAEKARAEGFSGFVVCQGTDTLEETVFFLNLYWKHPEPIVVTGAMRSASDVSADGAMNMLAAVRVVTNVQSRNRGVLLCMNHQIHDARWVRKSNTTGIQTFESPIFGSVGLIHEDEVVYLRDTSTQHGLRGRFDVPQQYDKKVFMLLHGLEDDPAVIDWLLSQNYAGLVSVGVGSGHVSFDMRDRLIEIAKNIPVVMCSRTWTGSTTEQTYGYIGSEMDLKKHGILMSGFLNPLKTRLLLLACVWSNMTRAGIEVLLSEQLS